MMTKLLAVLHIQETHTEKATFFITFGCLVSADQPTINYKSRLQRKLTQTLDFSQILISHIAHHRSM